MSKPETIAAQIRAILASSNTFTLMGGYALVAGETVRFPAGVIQLEKRNDKGQMAHARYVYADGSTLTYKRRPDNNFVLTVGGAA